MRSGSFRQLIERLPRPAARWSRLFGLGILVGALGGITAVLLHAALNLGTGLLVDRVAPDVAQGAFGRFHWMILMLPALGGLASGVLVQVIFREPFGHGTDIYVRSFHREMGALPLKGPLVKGVAAAGVISCGGSAGPEGPVAAMGAALGSMLGRLFHLTPKERRILLVAGCAAGVGAIFLCPLGGALFATSVLYREEEFEAEAIVPAFVASVIGYSTFIEFYGQHRYLLYQGGAFLNFNAAVELLPYFILGPLCGLVAIFFSFCLGFVERELRARAPLPRWLLPALGGLGAGAIACLLPQVMDGQYEFITHAMRGFEASPLSPWAWAGLFGAVIVAKCAATALTVGSGASGGVLGPSVFVGGGVGAFLGAVLHAAWPQVLVDNPQLREALIPVGMGGVLAAGMRTPLAAIVMVSEMTGSYGLIVPLMVVCMSAYVVGRAWGLNPEQVRSAADSPAHAADAIIHLLESRRVSEAMIVDWPYTVPPSLPLGEMVKRMRPGTRPVFAVAERDRLLGLISIPEFHRVLEQEGVADAVIALDMMREELVTLRPDQDLYEALSVFRECGHDVLPVISEGAGPWSTAASAVVPRRWLGMLTRERIFSVVQSAMARTQESVLREHTGLAAIEQEGQLQQLVMGVSPMRKDVIQRLMVPLDAVGRSIRQTDFRRRYGAQVIGVEQPDGKVDCPPNLDAPLRVGQRLLAITPGESRGDGGSATPSVHDGRGGDVTGGDDIAGE